MEPPLFSLQSAAGFPGRTLKLRNVHLQSLSELSGPHQQSYSQLPPAVLLPVLPLYFRPSAVVASAHVTQPPPTTHRVPRKRWQPSEDVTLRALVEARGVPSTLEEWEMIADGMPTERTAKRCRARWKSVLAPGHSRRAWTPEEDELVLSTQARLGNAWSTILDVLPGRTYTGLKKR